MTLQPRRPVQQVRQEDVVPHTNMDIGMEDGSATTAEESSVQRLLLEKQAVMVMVWYNKTTLYPTSIWMLEWMAVQLEHQQFVTYMLEKQAVIDMPVQRILKPAVQLEHQQFVTYMLEKEAVMDTSTTHTEADGTTGTPAVCHLHAQEASCDSDAVVQQDNVVPNINMDIGRPGYPEAQHRSIEDNVADAEAMDIDNAVSNDPIGL